MITSVAVEVPPKSTIARPPLLTGPPRASPPLTVPPQDLTMDALSELLRAVKLSGAVFFNAECRAPWCLLTPPSKRYIDAARGDIAAPEPHTEARVWHVLREIYLTGRFRGDCPRG